MEVKRPGHRRLRRRPRDRGAGRARRRGRRPRTRWSRWSPTRRRWRCPSPAAGKVARRSRSRSATRSPRARCCSRSRRPTSTDGARPPEPSRRRPPAAAPAGAAGRRRRAASRWPCWAAARAATRRRSARPISGSRVALIDRCEQLGGVCLNVGCIPSKALLHVAKVISEARRARRGRHRVRPAEARPRQAARVEGRRRGRLTGGLIAGQAAQGPGRARRRRRSPGRTRSRRRHRRRLRALHHRGGLGGGDAAVPARRSAHHGLDRRARGRRRSPSGCW